MAEKVLITEPEVSVQPIPARYLQLPTVITNILQDYFIQTEERWLPSSEYLVYVEGNDISKIEQTLTSLEIYRLENYRGDSHTKLPKILVRRSAVAKQPVGIAGNLRHGMSTSNNLRGVHAHSYVGTVVCFCMSRNIGQADHLGAECEQLLSHFSERIRRELLLKLFRVAQIGDIGKLKEFPEFFVVPVVIDYAYEDNVQVINRTFPVRNIQLELGFK